MKMYDIIFKKGNRRFIYFREINDVCYKYSFHIHVLLG